MENRDPDKGRTRVTEAEKLAIRREIEKIHNGSVTIIIHEGKRTQINTRDIVYCREKPGAAACLS